MSTMRIYNRDGRTTQLIEADRVRRGPGPGRTIEFLTDGVQGGVCGVYDLSQWHGRVDLDANELEEDWTYLRPALGSGADS